VTGTDPTRPRQTVTEALTRFLVRSATLGETLQWVAGLALTEIEPAAGVGLTLLEGRTKPVTVFASPDAVAALVDQAQYDADDGPCLQAYRKSTVTHVGDSAGTAARWPSYARAAAESGIGSSLSLPLTAADETYGALNLYATNRFAFRDTDIAAAREFSACASIVLANASAYWDARDLAAGLAEAMRSRAAIEQAKGKLMASGRLDADEAFQVLVRASQRSNIPLREVAERIVSDRDPSPPRTSRGPG
jgi:GAF domain-containing protein